MESHAKCELDYARKPQDLLAATRFSELRCGRSHWRQMRRVRMQLGYAFAPEFAPKLQRAVCRRRVANTITLAFTENQNFMASTDPRIDAYIAKSAEFARPILNHLRKLVHRGCPKVEETLKWSMPAFVYKGLLCSMAAFKQHATFGFWKQELVVGKGAKKGAMGQMGRITSLQDLPGDKILFGYIRRAVELNEEGVKNPSRNRARRGEKREIQVPDFLVAALKKNKKAQSNFVNFSYSHKREYVDWIAGAKRQETQRKRLETALAWIAEGKPQNWKYMRC